MISGVIIYREIFAHFLIYCIRKPFLIYATASLGITLYSEENLIFFFISVEFKATVYVPFESLDAEGGVGVDAGRLGPGEGAALLPLLAVTQGPN
jgi:hypothetical protein